MSERPPQRVDTDTDRQTGGSWLPRGWLTKRRVQAAIFLFIGVFTPVGVLVVNGSAYVMQHLYEFRVTLAVSAFVSNVFLQGLAVYAALQQASRRFPAIYNEYRRVVAVIAALGVAGWSLFGAWGTYVSMQDPRHLPNAAAVLISLWLLALPIVTVVIGRFLGKRKAPRGRGALYQRETLR